MVLEILDLWFLVVYTSILAGLPVQVAGDRESDSGLGNGWWFVNKGRCGTRECTERRIGKREEKRREEEEHNLVVCRKSYRRSGIMDCAIVAPPICLSRLIYLVAVDGIYCMTYGLADRA